MDRPVLINTNMLIEQNFGPGVSISKIELPDGLDWDTLREAVTIVLELETHADSLAADLVIALYPVLSRK